MPQFRQEQTCSPRTRTRSPPPWSRAICCLLRRSKTDMPGLVARQTRSTITESGTAFSCDDAEPFHFSIKPDAVNHQRERGDKRTDCTGQINWRALNHIDPDAPRADSKREQR